MKNDQMNDNSENLQAIFSQVRTAEFSAPAFMRTRVLAHVRANQAVRKKLFFWKAVSSLAMVALVLVSVLMFQSKSVKPDNQVHQVYVIHVDFNQDDQTRVAKAEVELPDGVQFESKRAEIRDLRKLALPVAINAVGRGKLPFVLSSKSSGEKLIKVRLLDQDNQLVREQVMKFKFAQAQAAEVL